MSDPANFEVIIIGGSYAGLSAAMALGRSLRKALIIDSGLPCNRQTPHSHNFITQDGEPPAAIAQKAKAQVLRYNTVHFHEGLAVNSRKTADGFEIGTAEGEVFTAQKLIFATGIKDLMPDIKGFAQCWGISVVHCPYCHGYELRGQKTAIMANAERGYHLASLVRNLSEDVTLITSGKAAFDEAQLAKLHDNNIEVIETGVTEIVHDNGHVKHVVFSDGAQRAFEAVYASIPFEQHSGIPAALGCELTEMGYIKLDAFLQTTVPGVYACGDNSNPMRSVATAVAMGNMAGAMVNKALTDESF